MITHIVFFKLKDRTPAGTEEARSVLLAMNGRIPELRHLEVGIDVVRSPRSHDIALVTRFDSLEDLAVYQAHPVHQEVVRYIQSAAESSIAVDYETTG